ncbi:hypothetical protein PM082_021377 [Marasmius tenuissimus]|nr:hypothetical protein PM082_021377 [Marasmius tenuissimus]
MKDSVVLTLHPIPKVLSTRLHSMSSDEEIALQAVEVFTSVEVVIVQPISTLSAMFLVYGKSKLMLIYMRGPLPMRVGRRESPASKTYTRWIVALFVLTTVYVAIVVWTYVGQTLIEFNVVKTRDYIPLFKSLDSEISRPANTARSVLIGFSSVIISCIFDYLMVHRCYVIWGYSKWILYPFAFIVVVADVISIVVTAVGVVAYRQNNTVVFRKINSILFGLAVTTAMYTSLLTLLTAGRIWWTVRRVGQITGSRVYTKCKIFVATILESGLLFSAMLVVDLIFTVTTDPNSEGLFPFDFNVISVQMAGIAQSLMVVRIAYGQSVDSVQQMVSTLQFVEGVNSSQQRPTDGCGTVDLRRSFLGVEERSTVGRIETDKPPSNVAGNHAV